MIYNQRYISRTIDLDLFLMMILTGIAISTPVSVGTFPMVEISFSNRYGSPNSQNSTLSTGYRRPCSLKFGVSYK